MPRSARKARSEGRAGDRTLERRPSAQAPWAKGAPRSAYEDHFWELARFASVNRLSMRDAFALRRPEISRDDDLLGEIEQPQQLFRPRYMPNNGEIRYCPICAQYGWVPDLYSLAVIRHCPIHNTALTTSCSNCGSPVKALHVSRSNHPFLCQSCGHPWCGAPIGDSDFEADWPPHDRAGARRLEVLDRAAARFAASGFHSPASFIGRNSRGSFLSSVWKFIGSMAPEEAEALCSISSHAEATSAYALSYKTEKWWEWAQQLARDSEGQARISEYLGLRNELAPLFGMRFQQGRKLTWIRRGPVASRPRWMWTSAESQQAAFMRWRRGFEGLRSVEPAKDEIFDTSSFFKRPVAAGDWLSYCVVRLFEALDESVGADESPALNKPMRRSCVLASAELFNGTNVYLISQGRWPAIDEVVQRHGLALAGTEVWRLLETSNREYAREGVFHEKEPNYI